MAVRFVASCNSAGARNVAGLEELLEGFAAHRRDHFRVGDAAHAREFFQAEKARAVAYESGPVAVADELFFRRREAGLVERRFRLVTEQGAVCRDNEPV